MGLCAPAVVAAHAALESSAADDRLIVVPGQLVKVAGVFQFMGRVGQRREGHAVPCKADAYIQSAAGDSCTVHAGAAAALLRVDRGVLGKILPDVVVPRTHLAACSAVGGGLPGAKTQIGDFRQLPTQREEQTELRQLSARALPGLEELCTASDGNKYIVPIGIHKSNVIFYNIHVFEELGIALPDHEDITWEEFWSLCDQLAEKLPDGRYPIDLGDRKGWPASQVFEDIMLGTDPKIYQDFINGIYNVEDVTKVLSTYAKLMDYVAPDHSSRDWYEASGQVVAGTYAMQIMGAWMQPLMTSMGQEYGKDYGIFTFPGTEGWFGMCIDGFVVSNDSADVEAGVRWAYNVSTQEVQTSFSALKESISPYSDTPDDTYCPLTLKFKEQLMSDSIKVYPSFTHGTALPWSASTSLQTQIQEFATSSDLSLIHI